MNWYKRYPSDYMGKTAHLSLTEHGAYNVLLDHCYSQETLSSDKDAVYRIARAFTQQERDAVDSVLLQYFVLTGDCYTNKRVNKELAKATEQSIQNSNNGKLGGRGIKRKESETKASALQNESETKAKQKALPDYQTTRLPDTTLPDTREREVDKPPRSPKIVSKFEKPTLVEIRTYCEAIGASINPVTFFNHYEAVGWKVGKNSMKDWKAGVRGWNSRDAK